MRSAMCSDRFALLGVAIALLMSCDRSEQCRLQGVTGSLAIPPRAASDAWFLEGNFVRLRSSEQSMRARCEQSVLPGARIHASPSGVWIIYGDALKWVASECVTPMPVADTLTQFTAAAAVAFAPDNLVVAAVFKQPGKQGAPRSLFLVSPHRGEPTLLYISDASKRIADTTALDSEPSLMRRSRDGEWIWMVAGDLVCHLAVQDPLEAAGVGTCKGLRLNDGHSPATPARITDISNSGHGESLWIASNLGAFSWPPGGSPRLLPIGALESIDGSPEKPDVVWALTESKKLYRIDTSTGRNVPLPLPPGPRYQRVRAVAGRVLLLSSDAVAVCRNCTARDAVPAELDIQILVHHGFTDVADGPDGTLWLTGSDESALCTLRPQFEISWLHIVGVAAVSAAAVLALIRHRRGKVDRSAPDPARPAQDTSPADPPATAADPTMAACSVDTVAPVPALAQDPPARPSPPEDRRRTRGELLSQLSVLLPAQFEEVLYRANIPPNYLSAGSATQTARAIEALRYVEQQNQLEELARIIEQVLHARPPG